MRCPRCDWQSLEQVGPALTQLEQHVDDAEHPRCVGCARVLTPDEEQACDDRIGEHGRGCIPRGRELLAGILTCWADLHGEHRTWPRTAMLGGGGSGDMPRRLNRLELAATERWWLLDRLGPLTRLDWQLLEAARAGKEHLVDNLTSDPPDVRHELERWEDDWRHELRAPAANITMGIERVEWWVKDAVGPLLEKDWRFKIRQGGASASVRAAAHYLEVHMRWAGRRHPAFEEFLTDMTELHNRCQAAVGRAPVRPADLDVACLDCRGQLQHPLKEVTEERDGRRWTGLAVDMDQRVCAGCGRTYDEPRFRVAQAEQASRRAQVVIEGEVYGQVTRVARDLGRSRQTLYAWVNQGLARAWEQKGLVFVHVADAEQLHVERPMRKKRAS